MSDQVKRHLRKLRTIMQSDELTYEGRVFVLFEMWELTMGGEQ